MTRLTVRFDSTSEGYTYIRSDGRRFFMLFNDGGGSALYVGIDKDTPPQNCMIAFDCTLTGEHLQAAAIRYVLAYPPKADSQVTSMAYVSQAWFGSTIISRLAFEADSVEEAKAITRRWLVENEALRKTTQAIVLRDGFTVWASPVPEPVL